MQYGNVRKGMPDEENADKFNKKHLQGGMKKYKE